MATKKSNTTTVKKTVAKKKTPKKQLTLHDAMETQLQNFADGMAEQNKERCQDWKHKGSFYSLVLAEGTRCIAQKLPKGIKRGRMKNCFANAFRLSSNNPEYTYVEGFAINIELGISVAHAWVVDKNNRVIDNTWGHSETNVYLGIKFDTKFVGKTVVRKKCHTMLDAQDDVCIDFLKKGLPTEAKASKKQTKASKQQPPGIAQRTNKS